MKIVVVGAGASGLFVSLELLKLGFEVQLFEKESAIAKKLLIAGKSGLNITNNSDRSSFSKFYYKDHIFFQKLLDEFSNDDLREYLNQLGIETFVGTSQRVFPKTFKAAQLVKLIKIKLTSYKSFKLISNSTLQKIEKDRILINQEWVTFDRVIYCLGGASWKHLGSDGMWPDLFNDFNLQINPFRALNCGFEVDWSDLLIKNKALKNIKLSYLDQSFSGDIMITDYGIESGPVYMLSHYFQNDLKNNEYIICKINFVPDLNREQIKEKLTKRKPKETLSKFLTRVFKFDAMKLSLFNELKEDELENSLTNGKINILRARPIDEAISVSGGICMNEITSSFELKKIENHYVLGEMLDWSAPTGGFLLQACFSMAYQCAHSMKG